MFLQIKKIKQYGIRPVRWSRYNHLKIIRMKDSPQKIAGGMALGVFLGVMPGLGMIAAIILAGLLKVNRGAAIVGSVIFNIFAIPIWILSYPLGLLITEYRWESSQYLIYLIESRAYFDALIESGQTLLTGIIFTSLLIAVLSYIITYQSVILYQKHKRKKKIKNLINPDINI